MPYFQIAKARSREKLGTVEADDEDGALNVFAIKQGFWDFEDLAQSINCPCDMAKRGLVVTSAREPVDPIEGIDGPMPVLEPVYL